MRVFAKIIGGTLACFLLIFASINAAVAMLKDAVKPFMGAAILGATKQFTY